LDTPPFVAYRVTCGVSFTYGGIRAGADGAVLDHAGQPIPGLFAAGACVGGLYYGNSASGSSLISGAVQGRRAGRAAARGTTPRGTATRASVARGSVARGSVARGSVARGSVAR
jgi:tricarballylate dehydrogenase